MIRSPELFLVKWALALFVFAWADSSFAQCTSPSVPAGTMHWNGTNLRYCIGTTWRNTTTTSVAVSCAGTAAGTLQFLGGEPRYCDGTTWRRAAPTTNYLTCTSAQAGYFYYASANQYYWFCNGTNWRRIGP